MAFFVHYFICFIFLGIVLIGECIPNDKERSGLRIIGGEPARAGQFPFAAAFHRETTTGRYFCGGALISSEWILTAAHCLEEAIKLTIYLGSNSLTAQDDNRVTVIANTSILHPEYDRITYENDIGLIHLPKPVLLSKHISPIFLPSTDLQPDANVVSIGWGQTDDHHPGPVSDLNFVDVVTLRNEVCQNAYEFIEGENVICVTGSYNQGTCVGDSGTPLVRYVLNELHAEHVGVSSFQSFYGCETTIPSAYVKTYPYLQWIKSVTNIS